MKKWFFLPLLGSLVACGPTAQVQTPALQPGTHANLRVESHLPQDPAYEAMIAPYRAQMDAQMEQVLATTEVDLMKAPRDNVFGQLLADMVHERADQWAQAELRRPVDFSLINSGGIRAAIRKGPIKLRHIYEVMPFNNEIVLVEMKGADLLAMGEYFSKTRKYQPASHLRVELQPASPARLLVNAQEIQPEKTYLVGTSDFLSGGGDGMTFFAKGKIYPTQIRMRDVLVQAFTKRKTIPATQPESRFVQPANHKSDAE